MPFYFGGWCGIRPHDHQRKCFWDATIQKMPSDTFITAVRTALRALGHAGISFEQRLDTRGVDCCLCVVLCSYMARGGKSRVEIEAELAEFTEKKRSRKERRYYVCYFYTEAPHILRMSNARGHSEQSAWEFVLKRIKKDGNVENARLSYAKCVEPDASELPLNRRSKKTLQKKVVEEATEEEIVEDDDD